MTVPTRKSFVGELFECGAGHRFPEDAAEHEGPSEETGGLVLHLCPFCNPAETDPTAMPLSYIESLPATQEGWCAVTGNPCGTDTWTIGQPCSCPACQRYLRGLSRRDFAPAAGVSKRQAEEAIRIALERAFATHDGAGMDLDAVVDAVVAAVRALPEALSESGTARCAMCGKAATCLGAYEGHEEPVYGCDDCCGHGCEDGWCWNLAHLPEELGRLLTAVSETVDAEPDPADGWHYLPELPGPTDGIMIPYLAWNAGYKGSKALPRIIWWKSGKIVDLAKEWRDSGIYCWRPLETAPPPPRKVAE